MPPPPVPAAGGAEVGGVVAATGAAEAAADVCPSGAADSGPAGGCGGADCAPPNGGAPPAAALPAATPRPKSLPSDAGVAFVAEPCSPEAGPDISRAQHRIIRWHHRPCLAWIPCRCRCRCPSCSADDDPPPPEPPPPPIDGADGIDGIGRIRASTAGFSGRLVTRDQVGSGIPRSRWRGPASCTVRLPAYQRPGPSAEAGPFESTGVAGRDHRGSPRESPVISVRRLVLASGGTPGWRFWETELVCECGGFVSDLFFS